MYGPNGANDEFIEIFNNSGTDHTVAAASGTGYGIAASDGVLRCSIPNGTVIPNRGHYLCVNSVGYSLASYPAGDGTTATGDATYTTDIPPNTGIALFNNNVPANFSLANRLDAVGSAPEANTLYKEGTGYPALSTSGGLATINYSFYRDNEWWCLQQQRFCRHGDNGHSAGTRCLNQRSLPAGHSSDGQFQVLRQRRGPAMMRTGTWRSCQQTLTLNSS